MFDPLSQDSFEVESWEELFLWSISNGRKSEFIKKISAHISESNRIEMIKFDKYINKRRAEMKAQDIEEEKKRLNLYEKTKA